MATKQMHVTDNGVKRGKSWIRTNEIRSTALPVWFHADGMPTG